MNAPATHLTAHQRLSAIQTNCAELLRRMPAGWERWDVMTTREFKRACAAIRQAGTVPKALEVATQICGYYAADVSKVDPGAGS